jgi:hypothetical protein
MHRTGATDGPTVHGGRPTDEGGTARGIDDFDAPRFVCGLGKVRSLRKARPRDAVGGPGAASAGSKTFHCATV